MTKFSFLIFFLASIFVLTSCDNPSEAVEDKAMNTPSSAADPAMTEKITDKDKKAAANAALGTATAQAQKTDINNVRTNSDEESATIDLSKMEITQPRVSVNTADMKKPTVSAQNPTKETPVAVREISHQAWDAILRQYVSNSGTVNYQGIKNNSSSFDAYLASIQTAAPQNSWNRNKKMAYWINAYNAFTIKLILDHYPVSSIMDISGGKAWDVKWIKIEGKTYSLNQIEHEILRPQFNDARVHFAINCAAKSCPPIHNRAFTSANLNQKLNTLTRSFINDSSFNTITENKLTLSPIFNWYASDFGDLSTYISRYTDMEISADAAVEFNEYDWSLNR